MPFCPAVLHRISQSCEVSLLVLCVSSHHGLMKIFYEVQLMSGHLLSCWLYSVAKIENYSLICLVVTVVMLV
jgi:hypothetical protein